MMLRRRGLTRPRVLIPVAGLAVAAAAATALTAGPSPLRIVDAGASVGCSVSYSVSSQWNTGFTAAVTVTNVGSPITSWTLRYGYSGNQSLSQGWSGNWSQAGSSVTVANAAWNGTRAPGGSAQPRPS